MGNFCGCCSSSEELSREDRDNLLDYLHTLDAEIEGLTLVFDGEKKWKDNARIRNSIKRDLLFVSLTNSDTVVKTELETRLKILRSL